MQGLGIDMVLSSCTDARLATFGVMVPNTGEYSKCGIFEHLYISIGALSKKNTLHN